MMYRGRKVDVVLDVRTALERLLGKVSGSVHVPMGRLEDAVPRLPGVGKTSTIVVHCASGVRSATAVATLRRMGYVNAIDGGGLADVRRELTQG
jgi:rhodanese-related sulfurtransferase